MTATRMPKNAATPMMVVASRKRMTALTQIARLEKALKRYASSFKVVSFGVPDHFEISCEEIAVNESVRESDAARNR